MYQLSETFLFATWEEILATRLNNATNISLDRIGTGRYCCEYFEESTMLDFKISKFFWKKYSFQYIPQNAAPAPGDGVQNALQALTPAL